MKRYLLLAFLLTGMIAKGQSEYEITMAFGRNSYRNAPLSPSSILASIRVTAISTDGLWTTTWCCIRQPVMSSRMFTPAQTQAQIEAANEAAARAKLQQNATADFSICTMEEREMPGFGGRPGRRMNVLSPLASAPATKEQVNEEQRWHNLEKADRNFLTFWVNYTEATYRNIKVSSADGKVLFEGTPGDVRIPAVAQQWTAFGDGGKYRLIKDDAVNMRYSQEMTAGKTEAGIFQGPQNIISGEKYVGSIYAKGKVCHRSRSSRSAVRQLCQDDCRRSQSQHQAVHIGVEPEQHRLAHRSFCWRIPQHV